MRALRFTIGAVVVALALGAAAEVASGTVRSAVTSRGTDPIIGTFAYEVGYDHAPRIHTITATPDGFKITVVDGYRVGGTPVPGTVFWAIERVGIDQADTDPANCTVAPGTVVAAQLHYTSTDASGVRYYTGVGLKAVGAVDSPHTCTFVGMQAPFYATLARHGDTADKVGPYNILCWNDTSPTANSCSTAFIRLTGTWTPGAAKPSTTATPTQPLRGLIPKSPKGYLDPRFKNDHIPPVVKAIASTGQHGRPFFLDYTSKDNRGFAGETYAIFSGKKLLKMWSVMAGERDGRMQRAPSTLPASVRGKLTFCVGGQDLNGNRSAWSCAPLTIS
jgi:hypothetical protein